MDISMLEEKLDLILKEITKLKSKDIEIIEPYQSKETAEINTAISKANSEFPLIEINRQNPYLAAGYSDLHEIMKKIRPILSKNGLHIQQYKKPIDGKDMLITRIWHSSGQWLESRTFLFPSKNNIQSYGSNLNSMKRFEIMNILGLTVSEDPFDDDGESDMQEAHELTENGTKLKALYNKKNESYETITKEQYGELMIELNDQEDLTEEILDTLHLKSLRELPKTRFLPTINRIRKIKKIRGK